MAGQSVPNPGIAAPLYRAGPGSGPNFTLPTSSTGFGAHRVSPGYDPYAPQNSPGLFNSYSAGPGDVRPPQPPLSGGTFSFLPDQPPPTANSGGKGGFGGGGGFNNFGGFNTFGQPSGVSPSYYAVPQLPPGGDQTSAIDPNFAANTPTSHAAAPSTRFTPGPDINQAASTQAVVNPPFLANQLSFLPGFGPQNATPSGFYPSSTPGLAPAGATSQSAGLLPGFAANPQSLGPYNFLYGQQAPFGFSPYAGSKGGPIR